MPKLSLDGLNECLNKIDELPHSLNDLSAVIGFLNETMGALTMAVIELEERYESPIIHAQANIDPDWLEIYKKNYAAQDPSFKLLSSTRKSVIDHVTSGRPGHLRGSERSFYHEFMLPQQYRYTLARLAKPQPFSRLFVVTTRTENMKPFDQRYQLALDLISDKIVNNTFDDRVLHNKRGCIFNSNSNLNHNLSQGITAVIVVDSNMRVMGHNSNTHFFLSEGYCTISTTLRLEFTSTYIQTQVLNTIEELISSSNQSYSKSQHQPSKILTSKDLRLNINASSYNGNSFCIELYYFKQSDTGPLLNHSALTSAERYVLELYMDGLSPQQIAFSGNKSIHTIRSQIKSIKRKLQVSHLPRNYVRD